MFLYGSSGRIGNSIWGSYCFKCLLALAAICALLFLSIPLLNPLVPPTCVPTVDEPTSIIVTEEPTAVAFHSKHDGISSLIDYVNALGNLQDTRLARVATVDDHHVDEAFVKRVRSRLQYLSTRQELQGLDPGSAGPNTNVLDRMTTINLTIVACEDRGRENAKILLKSALIFSQDAHLHAFVFSDNRTIPSLAMDLLELRWTAAARGWAFTFSVHSEWFPADDIPWRKMWAPCSTQRLFIPDRLPEVDAAIYLDTDVIILSNLTEVWLNIENRMNGEILAAMASNTERPAPAHDDVNSKIPIYGYGLQAGVVLMNLTRMREFKMVDRAVGAYKLYHERLQLADQDIYNAIFATYKEKLFLLNCTYDFTHVHCGNGPKQWCLHQDQPGPLCFCESAMTEGVRIVHGNGGTFRPEWPFLYQLQQGFKNIDLLMEDPLAMIGRLMKGFDELRSKPACFSLTSTALYANAKEYLENIKD